MTTPTPTDSGDSQDRRLAVGSAADTAGEGPSSTRRSGVGEGPSSTRRSGVGEGPSSTRRSWGKRLPHFDVLGLIQHITFHLADSLPRSAIERMQQELAAIPEAQSEVARRQRIQELLDSGLGSCVLAEPACAEIVQDSLLFGDGDRYHLLAWVVMPNHVHVLIEQIPGWPLAKVVQSWKRHTSRQIHRLTLGSPSFTRPDADYKSALPAPGSSSFTRLDTECKSALPAPGSSSFTRPDTECNSVIRTDTDYKSVIPTDTEYNSVIPTDADYKSALPGGAIPALWQRDYWDRFIRNDRHFQSAKRYIENNPVAAGLVATPEAWPWSSASFADHTPAQFLKEIPL